MIHLRQKKLHHFFEEVYDHFFQNSDEETIQEGFEESTSTTPNTSDPTNMINQYAKEEPLKPIASSNTRPTYVSNYEFGPSLINPVLKETMHRVMFIDSQYRNYNLYYNSTNFKFNLSEPLLNVVSLKITLYFHPLYMV